MRHYLVTERFFLIFKLLLLTLTQQTWTWKAYWQTEWTKYSQYRCCTVDRTSYFLFKMLEACKHTSLSDYFLHVRGINSWNLWMKTRWPRYMQLTFPLRRLVFGTIRRVSRWDFSSSFKTKKESDTHRDIDSHRVKTLTARNLTNYIRVNMSSRAQKHPSFSLSSTFTGGNSICWWAPGATRREAAGTQRNLRHACISWLASAVSFTITRFFIIRSYQLIIKVQS